MRGREKNVGSPIPARRAWHAKPVLPELDPRHFFTAPYGRGTVTTHQRCRAARVSKRLPAGAAIVAHANNRSLCACEINLIVAAEAALETVVSEWRVSRPKIAPPTCRLTNVRITWRRRPTPALYGPTTGLRPARIQRRNVVRQNPPQKLRSRLCSPRTRNLRHPQSRPIQPMPRSETSNGSCSDRPSAIRRHLPTLSGMLHPAPMFRCSSGNPQVLFAAAATFDGIRSCWSAIL